MIALVSGRELLEHDLDDLWQRKWVPPRHKTLEEIREDPAYKALEFSYSSCVGQMKGWLKKNTPIAMTKVEEFFRPGDMPPRLKWTWYDDVMTSDTRLDENGMVVDLTDEERERLRTNTTGSSSPGTSMGACHRNSSTTLGPKSGTRGTRTGKDPERDRRRSADVADGGVEKGSGTGTCVCVDFFCCCNCYNTRNSESEKFMSLFRPIAERLDDILRGGDDDARHYRGSTTASYRGVLHTLDRLNESVYGNTEQIKSRTDKICKKEVKTEE